MKKVFGLIGFLAIMVSGTAFAQTTQSHDVTVTIPSYLKIRMVDGAGALVSAPDAIAFDYGAAANAGSFTPGTPLPRTSTNNWADVEVASNDGGWKVNVSTTTTSGFDWSKVIVNNGGSVNFDLTSTADIATGTTTAGWTSLGFGPANFSITFDGTEAATTTAYQDTVTYSITATP